MLRGKLAWYNNIIKIVEKQLTANDKQQECVNIGIKKKVFCYLCKTPFEG